MKKIKNVIKQKNKDNPPPQPQQKISKKRDFLVFVLQIIIFFIYPFVIRSLISIIYSLFFLLNIQLYIQVYFQENISNLNKNQFLTLKNPRKYANYFILLISLIHLVVKIILYALFKTNNIDMQDFYEDFEFYFLSNEYDSVIAMIYAFLPNSIIFIVQILHLVISNKQEQKVTKEYFENSKNKVVQNIIQFLTMVFLLFGQIFNISILGIIYFILFLVQNISYILKEKSYLKFSYIYHNLIQAFCYVQMFFITLNSTSNFKYNQNWDSYYLGIDIVTNALEKQEQNLFVINFVLIFILSQNYVKIIKYEQNQQELKDLIKIAEQNQQKLKTDDTPQKTPQKRSLLQRTTKFSIYVYESVQKSFFNQVTVSFVFLRLLQLYSVVVIMRYPSFISLPLIIWVMLNTLVYLEQKYQFISILFLVIPSLVLKIVFIIFSSMNKDQPQQPQFGFVFKQNFWLECIILNVLIFLFFTYLQILQKSLTNLFHKENQETATFFNLLMVIIMNNSYDLALFILFWICFQTINIIHLIFVIIFLIFLINKEKPISVQVEKRVFQMTFAYKYWVILVIYTSIFILVKFLYFLIITYDLQNQQNDELLEIIGIIHDYQLEYSIGFTEEDFGSLTIVWVAFLFFSLQQDTYRSKIYLRYKNCVAEKFSQLYLIKKYIPNFNKYAKQTHIIFTNMFFWISLFFISLLLILSDFNFFNSILLIMIFLLIYYQTMYCIDKTTFNYMKCFAFWKAINLLIFFYVLFFYIYLFTDLKYIQENVIDKENQIYKNFNEVRDLVGFIKYDSETKSLKMIYLPIIIVLYLSTYVQNYYFKVYTAIRYQVKAYYLDNMKQIKKKITNQEIKTTIFEVTKQLNNRGLLKIQKALGKTSQRVSEDENDLNVYMKSLAQKENEQNFQNFIIFNPICDIQGIKYISKLFVDTQINILSIIIFISGVIFRLSLSLLFYLILCLYYYYFYYKKLIDLIQKNQMSNELDIYFTSYYDFFTNDQTNLNWKIQENKTSLNTKEDDLLQHQETQQQYLKNKTDIFQKIMNEFRQQKKTYSRRLANKINRIFFILSLVCTYITYASQFWVTEGASSFLSQSVINEIQWYLFIFGVSCTKLTYFITFRSTYFYVLILWANVLIIVFENLLAEAKQKRKLNTQEDEVNQTKDHKRDHKYSMEALQIKINHILASEEVKIKIFNKMIVINDYFLLEEQRIQNLNTLMVDYIPKQQSNVILPKQSDNIIVPKQSDNLNIPKISYNEIQQQLSVRQIEQDCDFIYNKYLRIQYYYQMKTIYLTQRMKYGSLYFIFPLYSLILLTVSIYKNDVFSYVYLITSLSIRSMKEVNIATTVIVLIQYITLILNINEETSPLEIDENIKKVRGTSIVQQFIDNKKWLDYFSFNNSQDDLIAFVLNSMVFILIGIYFQFYNHTFKTIHNKISNIKQVIQNRYIKQQFPSLSGIIYINFKAWKNSHYEIINLIYEFVFIFGPIISLFLIIIICLSNYNLYNLITIIYCLLIFFYLEFVAKYPDILMMKQRKKNMLRVLYYLQYLILFISSTVKIPSVDEKLSDLGDFLKTQIKKTALLQQIFIIFLLDITNLLLDSNDYLKITTKYIQKITLQNSIKQRSYSIYSNDQKLGKLQNIEKQKKKMNQTIKNLTKLLNKWHENEQKKEQSQGQQHNRYQQRESLSPTRSTRHIQLKDNDSVHEQSLFLRKQNTEQNNNKTQNQIQQEAQEVLKNKEENQFDFLNEILNEFTSLDSNMHRNFQKLSIFSKTLFYMSRVLRHYTNQFLFFDINQMVDYLVQKNKSILGEIYIDIHDIIEDNNTLLMEYTYFLYSLYIFIYELIQVQDLNYIQENFDSIVSNFLRQKPEFNKIYQNFVRTKNKVNRQFERKRYIQAISDKQHENELKNIKIYHDQFVFEVYNYNLSKENNFFGDSVFIFFQIFMKFLISQFYVFCFILFAIYYLKNNALLSLPIVITVFLYLLIQEERIQLKIWGLSYIYLCFAIIFKYLIQLEQVIQNYQDYNFIFDQNYSLEMEGILLFFIFFEELILKKSGLVNFDTQNFENIYQAYIRNLINDEEFQEDEKQSRNLVSAANIRSLIMSGNNKNVQISNLNLLDNKQDIHQSFQSDIKYESQLLNSYYQVRFFKQLFSKYNQKPGKDLYPFIALIQVIILLYTFLFYQLIEDDNNKITDQFQTTQFSGGMVITIFVEVMFLVTERFIALKSLILNEGQTDEEKAKKKKDEEDEKKKQKRRKKKKRQEKKSLMNLENQKISSSQKKVIIEEKNDQQNKIKSPQKQNQAFHKQQNEVNQLYQQFNQLQNQKNAIKQEEENRLHQLLEQQKQNELKQQSGELKKQQQDQQQQQQSKSKQLQEEGIEQIIIKIRAQSNKSLIEKQLETNVAVAMNQDYQMQQLPQTDCVQNSILQISEDLDEFENNEQNTEKNTEKLDHLYQTQIIKINELEKLDLKNTQDKSQKEKDNFEYLLGVSQKNQSDNHQLKIDFYDNLKDQLEPLLQKLKKKKLKVLKKCKSSPYILQRKPQDVIRIVFDQNRILNSSLQDIKLKKSEQKKIKELRKQQLQQKNILKQRKKELKKRKEKLILKKSVLKYIQLSIILTVVCWFVFFYIPQPFQKKDLKQDSSYTSNIYLNIFFFLCCVYFFFSALQLKFGYKQFKQRNILLNYKNALSSGCVSVINAIPFLFELKVIMDWAFSSTNLSLNQWFTLENIHFILYSAKVSSMHIKGQKIGKQQSKITKIFMGQTFLYVILILIFGPMLLFSNLNPVQDANGVQSANIQVQINVNQNNQINHYQIFNSDHIINLQNVKRNCLSNSTISSGCYWSQNFTQVKDIMNSDENQFQIFQLETYSINNWDLSKLAKDNLIDKLKQASNNKNGPKISLIFSYEITRVNSVTNKSSQKYPSNIKNQDSDGEYLSQEKVQELYKQINDCSQTQATKLSNFYTNVLKLTTKDQTFTINPIDENAFLSDIYIKQVCVNKQNNQQSISYWTITKDKDGNQGFDFFVLSDKYSSLTFGFSIITLYTSVILVIGKLLRDQFSGDIQQIIFSYMPNSDLLLTLCESIAYARTECDFVKENILFYELMDLIRSPEILKKLTGSYSDALTEKYKNQLKKEKEKLKQELQKMTFTNKKPKYQTTMSYQSLQSGSSSSGNSSNSDCTSESADEESFLLLKKERQQ